jgi:AI-2 transport protein TqsA
MDFLIGTITTVMVGWVLHVGAAILLPLVFAFLLASMIAPVVRRAARWRIPAAVTVMLMLAALFYLIANLGLVLRDSLTDFVGGANGAAQNGARMDWPTIVTILEQRFRDSAMPDALARLLSEGLKQLDAAALTRGGVIGGLGFTRDLVVVMIYMIFIFAEARLFQRKILAIAGDRREDARRVLEHVAWGIQRYLLVKTFISLLTGGLCYFLLLALDVPYAMLLGLLTFLLNFIPVFGSIIAGILATLVALAAGDTWTPALFTAIGYLVVNMFLGNYLDPKILGKELNLSPLMIVVSVVVWSGIWGVAGAFLAVPITSVMQVILLSYERTRPIAVLLSGSPPRFPAAASSGNAPSAHHAPDES